MIRSGFHTPPRLPWCVPARGATVVRSSLPRSLPFFFASLMVAITLAFVGTVVSETIASNEGIGYLMMSAGSSMKMSLVFAGLFVIGVMAMVMYEFFAILERRMTGWAHRGTTAG
jgi:NitT/TauT family transport system permease protein